ncbi:hypothetical protein HU200_029264 [Digitaria exilis]|uniref:Uncharacterized protein n=1 Tax=Digitaria exilis TaxID=1010633 RepID=A0A835BYZ2_9POAL|nr:hypothetical protein HU200_029264 [Digitaria exilis]
MNGQLSMRMRCLRPSGGGRRRCPVLGGDTAAFCASLVEGLAHLESTLEVEDNGGGGGVGSGSVSMRWCADAMRLVKRMQREMLEIFRKADVPAASVVFNSGGGVAAAAAGDWFEHYMQETAALLDFCNAFKTAVSRIHRYCMVVDFAAHLAAGDAAAAASLVVVESAAAAAACQLASMSPTAFVKNKIAGAKAAVTDAERLGRTIVSGGGGGGGAMVVVTLVAKITTSILSIFVLQALTTSPTSLDVDAGGSVGPTLITSDAVDDVPELGPWCESLSLIHARFPSKATVVEHEKVAMVVRDLINGKANGGGGHGGQQEGHVELLRARSGELREGVEMFDCVLDEVFDEVIRGRNEMLAILRDKALT